VTFANLSPVNNGVCGEVRIERNTRRRTFLFWLVRRPKFGAEQVATAAQVEQAKKAAAKKKATRKVANRPPDAAPKLASDTTPQQVPLDSHSARGPPRLLYKQDVLAITGVTFPTIWHWMRDGRFPRGRVVSGDSSKTVWLASEIEAWMQSLPVRPLKGDQEP
jgi:predicted DNA-binding transcriptional regulator AlpA